MAGGRIAPLGGEQIQVLRNRIRNRLAGIVVNGGGGQFYPQRQSLGQMADAGNGRFGVSIDRKVRGDGARPRREQLSRARRF